jgi:hypothetical protein
MLHAKRNTAFLKFCNCRKQRRLVFGSELADGHVALFYRNNNAFLKGIQPFVERTALSKRGGSLHETPHLLSKGLKSWLGMFSVM